MAGESGNAIPLPSIWLSLVPLVAMLAFSVCTFGIATLSGASQLTLLVAAAGLGIKRAVCRQTPAEAYAEPAS